MDKKELLAALESAVVSKQEGLVFSVTIDGKKIIKEVVEKAILDAVASSENKYDDQLVQFVLPFVDKYLEGK